MITNQGGNEPGQAGLYAALLFILLSLSYLLTAPPVRNVPVDYSPNSLIPLALLRDGSFDLKPYDHELQPRQPNSVAVESGPYLVSFYPVGASISALPFYVPFFLGGGGFDRAIAEYLGQVAALIFVAASAVLIFLIARELLPIRWALFLAILCGLGTSNFSILNKALWQHSPAVFWIALALYGLTGSRRRLAGWQLLAGFCLGMAVFCRPSNLPLLLAATGAFAYHWEWRRAGMLLLGAVPPGLANLSYNVYYLGSPLSFGGYDRVGLSLVPDLSRMAGLLFSPARGLLIFLPFLLLLPVAVYGLSRCPDRWLRTLFSFMLLGSSAVIALSSGWHVWWGGYSYGPRLLSDLTPILVLSLVPLFFVEFGWKLWRSCLIGLAAVSILIHSMGALFPGRPYHWEAVYIPDQRDVRNLWRISSSPIPFYLKVWWRRATHSNPPPLKAASDCRGNIALLEKFESLRPGEVLFVPVEVTNLSDLPWWHIGPRISSGEVHLAYRWLDAEGGILIPEGARSFLWRDLEPGGRSASMLRLVAPTTTGDFILRVTLVVEGVVWCDSPGGTAIEFPVQVL